METFLIEGAALLTATIIVAITAAKAVSAKIAAPIGLACIAALSLANANDNLFVATVFAPFATVSAVVAAASLAVAAACFFLRAMLSF